MKFYIGVSVENGDYQSAVAEGCRALARRLGVPGRGVLVNVNADVPETINGLRVMKHIYVRPGIIGVTVDEPEVGIG